MTKPVLTSDAYILINFKSCGDINQVSCQVKGPTLYFNHRMLPIILFGSGEVPANIHLQAIPKDEIWWIVLISNWTKNLFLQ